MGIWDYQVVAAILFMLGVLGVLVRRNLIVMFMCIELMLNAANLSLVAFSRLWGNLDGQIFVFMVIVVAAVEVPVGLAIIISLVRNRDTVNIDDAILLGVEKDHVLVSIVVLGHGARLRPLEAHEGHQVRIRRVAGDVVALPDALLRSLP